LTFTFPPSVSVEGKIVPAYNFEKKKSWFEQCGHDLALCLKIEAGSAPDIILDSVWCKGNLAGLEKAVGKKFPESSLKLVAESEIIEQDRLFFIFEEGSRRPRVKVDSNGVLKIQLGFQDRDSKAVRFLFKSTTPHLVYRVNETFPQETAIDI
jgi:hypothetical protein